ncbi:MAG TPA: ABC transporter permease [Candidatus Sulfomarinibacteraceae bacterium]|nr:ABC transporter permease [Candidatus Sulfomarinibacteraceae bacterium]
MSEQAVPLAVEEPVAPEEESTRSSSGWTRIAKFTMVRAAALLATVVVGVYLAVIIANMGGHVDTIRRAQIREQVAISVQGNQELMQMPREEREAIINEQIRLAEVRLGLDQPFILRSFTYLGDALTLNLGMAEALTSDSGSRQVRNIIVERLPSTLVLFATAQLLLFFFGVFFALSLSRQYGSWIDKLVIAFTPTSSAPAWFYGLFLILVFAGVFRLLPFGGMVDAPPPEDKIAYLLSLLKHMILPVSAWLMSAIFLSIYNWRTFFLIYSSEDYVEMARAKGLPDKMIERRYILQPTLPNIITQFALLVIQLWTGAIILETVFNWPGLGRLYFQAIGLFDVPVIIANTVIYAYLLAFTVFLLDFLYALVDPRVRVEGGGRKL